MYIYGPKPKHLSCTYDTNANNNNANMLVFTTI